MTASQTTTPDRRLHKSRRAAQTQLTRRPARLDFEQPALHYGRTNGGSGIPAIYLTGTSVSSSKRENTCDDAAQLGPSPREILIATPPTFRARPDTTAKSDRLPHQMTHHSGAEFDVAIIGAGPVGMFLAVELAAFDLDVVHIEKRTLPDDRLRARVLQSRTLSHLARRDLLECLTPATPRGIVHFAGMEVIDTSQIAADYPYSLYVRQQVLEQALADRLGALARPPRYGHELIEITQDDDAVELQVRDTSQDKDYRIRARYAIACDGGRSITRRKMGVKFDGSSPSMVGFQGLAKLRSTDDFPVGWARTANGMYAIGPEVDRIVVLDYSSDSSTLSSRPTGQDNLLADEFSESVRRVVGPNVEVQKVTSLTKFTDNARIASSYRRGRILLAGDAAHTHPPFGGQGLNLGIQDAANLGWKLGAHAAWGASSAILDSYQSERRPVAEAVVVFARAQSALMRPDDQTTSLRHIVALLLDTPTVNLQVADMISGNDIRYPFPGSHCSGEYARDEAVELDGEEATLAGLQARFPGRPILLIGRDHDTSQLNSLAASMKGLIVCGVGENHSRRHDKSIRLVRPDGYLEWCEDDSSAAIRRAQTSFGQWCGRNPLQWN